MKVLSNIFVSLLCLVYGIISGVVTVLAVSQWTPVFLLLSSYPARAPPVPPPVSRVRATSSTPASHTAQPNSQQRAKYLSWIIIKWAGERQIVEISPVRVLLLVNDQWMSWESRKSHYEVRRDQKFWSQYLGNFQRK